MVLMHWHTCYRILFGYVDTQAQRRLEGLFIHPSALIFTFISVVLLRPLIDELLFRHLLIHELGKNLIF